MCICSNVVYIWIFLIFNFKQLFLEYHLVSFNCSFKDSLWDHKRKLWRSLCCEKHDGRHLRCWAAWLRDQTEGEIFYFPQKIFAKLGQIISPGKWSLCNKIIKPGLENRIFNSNNLFIQKCSMFKDLFWSITTQSGRPTRNILEIFASRTMKEFMLSSSS